MFALGNNGSWLGDVPLGQRTGQPTGITAVTPWDGSPGTQELVVGKLDGTTDQVFQWVNGALTAVPIGSGVRPKPPRIRCITGGQAMRPADCG